MPQPTSTGPSPILRYFAYDHLPNSLADVSAPFSDLAWRIERTLPPGAEKSTALRKLLEAKDAAVRAALDLPHPDEGWTQSDPSAGFMGPR